jgi:hypothetical protein
MRPGSIILQVFTLRDTTCHEVVKCVFSFIARLLSDQESVALCFLCPRLLQTIGFWYKPVFIAKNGLRRLRLPLLLLFCYCYRIMLNLCFNTDCCCVYVDCNMIWILFLMSWWSVELHCICIVWFSRLWSFPTAPAPFGWARQAGARRCFISNSLV